jgi:hypothetical protein
MASRVVWVVSAVLFAGALAGADEPKAGASKPPSQRMLTGDDARKAAELELKSTKLASAGKRDEAVTVAEELLALRTKVQGADHWQARNAKVLVDDLRRSLTDEQKRQLTEAEQLNARVQTAFQRGKAGEAINLAENALEIRKRILGKDHLLTAQSVGNLAALYHAQGKYADAEPLHKEALRIRRGSLGDEHPDTAVSLNNLAELYRAQGRHTDAELLFQEALRAHRKILGDEHPDIATNFNNLALLYQAQGRYADAEPLHKEALRIRRKAFGDQHPDTAPNLNNLALLYKAQGKYADAEPLFKDALRINQKALGDEHPDTAQSLNNLAELYRVQGRHTDAEALHKEALRIRRKILGDQHPDTAGSLNSLAKLYYDQGRYVDAEPVLAQATAVHEAARLNAARGIDRAFAAGFSPYRLLARNAATQNKPREAFAALEATLSRGLSDEIANRRSTGLKPDEIERRDRLTDQLNQLQPRVLFLVTRQKPTAAEHAELEAIATERNKLQAQLAELAVTISKRDRADLATVQKALPPDAAWVSWVGLADENRRWKEHWVCVVRHTGDPHWARLSGTGEKQAWTPRDTDLPVALRRAILGTEKAARRPAAEVDEFAGQLRAQWLGPVAKHLDGVKTLFVSASSLMAGGVPVELLVPEATVCYVPSATFLARLPERPRPTSTGVLALGDPIFARPGEKLNAGALPPGGLLITATVPDGTAAKAFPAPLQPDDVLLKYGDTELTSVDSLLKAITAHADRKTVPVVVWRASEPKPFTRDLAQGRLGVVLAPDPAPVALANRRRLDALVANRGGKLADLPGTRVEVSGLQKLFGKEAVVLIDSDASEQRLDALRKSGALAKFRYLHLATHGEGNTVRALESYLFLARDKLPGNLVARDGEPLLDGKLTAREVLDFWALDAELVTLSACETAIGQPTNSEGLLGFAQAFLVSGSRSVCVSLWRVDDTATALLMDRFYRNLLGKHEDSMKPIKPMGKAEALAEAKKWLRELSSEDVLKHAAAISNGVVRGDRAPGEKALPLERLKPEDSPRGVKPFAHPKFWAAFVLVGDPN